MESGFRKIQKDHLTIILYLNVHFPYYSVDMDKHLMEQKRQKRRIDHKKNIKRQILITSLTLIMTVLIICWWGRNSHHIVDA